MNREKLISALVAVLFSGVIVGALALTSVYWSETYAYGIFYLTPFIGGAVAVIIFNRKGKKGFKESLSVSALAGAISLLGFFVTGFEGVVCILMALPVVVPLFAIGGVFGYWISRFINKKIINDVVSIFICLLGPLFMGFEASQDKNINIREVVSKVVVDGNISDVWNEVVEFSPIPEPDELIFKMGIAYPTHAEIKGEGIGAIRYCYFSTGAFVEPITGWDVNKRLGFDVSKQPVPMTELSPYADFHPPHLDWAVISHRGEFLLNKREDGRVELIGTTWYHTVMEPEWYWGVIGDEMIHMIHRRVLEHIKTQVENKLIDAK